VKFDPLNDQATLIFANFSPRGDAGEDSVARSRAVRFSWIRKRKKKILDDDTTTT